MSVSTVTSKGQVTIPKNVREQLNLAAGDRVDFAIEEEMELFGIRPVSRSVRDLFGFLKRPGRPALGVPDMDRAVVEHLSEEDA